MSTKKFKLKNGLTVLLIENHKSPVVSVQMWVKTGSADEKRGEEGISHFIEHLVFKGTRKYGVGAIAATVEANGGELNAFTTFDKTVFYVTISKEFTETALDVICEMMGFPQFDAKEIDNEREVVIEEIKRSHDSPSRQSAQMLFSTVYKKHPYGIPVIGYDRIIRKVSRAKLLKYFHSRYVPKNMSLVIAGDFSSAEMKAAVAAKFSELRPHRLQAVKRAAEPKQAQTRLVVKKMPFEESHLYLAWKIPGIKHKDMVALDMLSMILGQGDSSRLVQRLRVQDALVNGVGMGTYSPRDQGMLYVSATLNPQQLPHAAQVIGEELQRIQREPPTAQEIARAITNLESEEFYTYETVDGLARKAGTLQTLLNDPEYFPKFLKQAYGLRPDDLVRTARKYLQPQHMSVIAMVRDGEKVVEKTLKDWVKSYGVERGKSVRAAVKRAPTVKNKKLRWTSPDEKHAPNIEKQQLASGISVIFRLQKATPVVSVKAAMLGGLRAEPSAQTGITDLLSRVWTSGTKNLSEAEIMQKMDDMAGGLSGFGGRNSAGMSLQVLSPFEKEAAEIFTEALVAPVMTEAAVEREKKVMLEGIRTRADNPSYLVSQMFSEAIFADHPYAREVSGTAETVPGMNLERVQRHFAQMAASRNLTLVVSGCADRSLWQDLAQRMGERLPKGERLAQVFSQKPPKPGQKLFRELNKEQTHIMIGYKGLTLADPRRYTLQIIQSVLSGQGGRLFLELRDKESLAYSVAPLHMEGLDAGYVGAYIGCSPEKGGKAIQMLRHELRKMAETALTAEEMDRAKRYLIGRHDIDLQRNSAIAGAILFNDIYGIAADEAFHFAERIRSIAAEDVRQLADQLFSQDEVLAAVGSQCPWS